MAIKYRVKKKRNGINSKENYYAIPVRSGVIGTREIAKYLAGRSSLTEGDVRATLIGLVEVMETFLKQGYTVKLDDMGVFSLSGTSDGYETPEECMPHCVRAHRLCFRADKEFMNKLEEVKFERDKTEPV